MQGMCTEREQINTNAEDVCEEAEEERTENSVSSPLPSTLSRPDLEECRVTLSPCGARVPENRDFICSTLTL